MAAGANRIRITLFAKILAAFILFMAPICALGVMINVWGHNSVRKEQMESARMSILLYLGGLEHEFSYSLRQQLGLLSNQDVALLTSAQGQYNDVDFYKAGIAVRKALSDIKEGSAFITDVTVYIPAKGTMLSTTTGYTQMSGDYEQMRAITQKGSYPFTDYSGGIVSCIASDTFLASNDTNSFLVGIRFSKEKIRQALKSQEDETQQRKAALISMGRGIAVMDESDPGIEKSLSDFAFAHKDGDASSGTDTIKTGSKTFFVTWAKSDTMQTMLIFYTPEEQFAGVLANYRYLLIALSALTAASVFLFSAWIRRLVIAPLNKLIDTYRSLEKGDFNVELKYGKNDEFGFLYERSNEMIRRLGSLIEQVYEQKLRASEAELKQLQYQINPHFLYNSILIIGNLIKMTDYDCAGRLVRHLGSYYQYLTKASDFVPLMKEAEHALNYVEIQKIRFADRFVCRFDSVPACCEDFAVPRLIMQPLIENSLKYGLADAVSGGELFVGISCAGGLLRISVEDNGKGLNDEKLEELKDLTENETPVSEASGLLNVHRRIRIKYGGDSGLRFARSFLGGLQVEIRIRMKGDGGTDQLVDRR